MAAPTNVEVQSNSPTQAQITWTYSGTNNIGVYRAPHSGAFTEITTPAANRVPVGTLVYLDNTAVAGTFYDYKLSDDNGATFSSIVSVVIQQCVTANNSTTNAAGPSLPRFTDDIQEMVDRLNELSHKVEVGLSAALSPPGYCTICSFNGAVVLDCTDGCKDFYIVTTEDINSISQLGCSQDGTTTFVVPPNTTRKIRGFAAGSSLGSNPITIVTGSSPKEVDVKHYCKCDSRIYGIAYIVYSTSGTPCVCDDRADGSEDVKNSGPSAVGSCNPNGGLTLVSMHRDGTANPNRSMSCSSADKGMNLQACGGMPPYHWSFTGSINFIGNSDGAATVLPPTNNGSGVAGNAYTNTCWECNDCPAPTCNPGRQFGTAVVYGCNDQVILCGGLGSCTPSTPAASQLTCHNGAGSPAECGGTPPNASCGLGPICSSPTTLNTCGGLVQTACDSRSGAMISAGCNPCGLIATGAGATVTVTDTVGTSVTITLRV